MSRNTPRISIIVIGYKMARQLENTLYSLSADYQINVNTDDYEILLIENESDSMFDTAALNSINADIRYYPRKESSPSPASAINFGLSKARGSFIGLMIDGARMVTPGVLSCASDALAISPNSLLAVPGYHLGESEHHYHLSRKYGEERELELLASIEWKKNGYKLFSISCFSGANPNGVLSPYKESNCIFSSAKNFEMIEGADERFDLPGGGALNLHMYRKLGLISGSRFFATPGEGSFHQFHGGVTTAETPERAARIEEQRQQLYMHWDGKYSALTREPEMLGKVSGYAMPFLQTSIEHGHARFVRLTTKNRPLWPDD